MKLKFIGTGSVGNTSCNTCIMIDDILFDCGNGVSLQLDLFKIDLNSINYLVITHFHGDHILDIPSLFLTRKIRKINNKLKIIGPKGLKEKLQELMAFSYGDGVKNGKDIEEKYNLEFIEIDENDEYLINNKVLKPYKLVHGANKEVQGYTYGNDIAYLVDTTLCDNVYVLSKKFKYVIIDVTFIETNDKHIGLNDLKQIAIENPNNYFYAVHRNDYIIDNKNNIYFPVDGDELTII